MYNGIGLATARGSGTNGYVQRNLSNVPNKQKRVEYKTEDELKLLDTELSRGPNLEILQHARKRQIELKCLEMRELMEEQNYDEAEIDDKVSKYRKMLLEKEAASEGSKPQIERDRFGRIIAKDTHEIAHAQAEKNKRFKEALGIPSNYVDGSSLEKLSTEKPEPQKYDFIEEIDDDETVPANQDASPPPSKGDQKLKKKGSDRKKKSKKSDYQSNDDEGDSDTSIVKHRSQRHRKRDSSESRSRSRSRSGDPVKKRHKKSKNHKRHRKDHSG